MKNKKGFTLAELLVVVAIIGVLAAISIPVFTAQKTKANQAVDNANARAAYAEVMSDILTKGSSTETQTFSALEDYDGTTKIGDATSIDWDAEDTVSVTATKGTDGTVSVTIKK